MHKVVFGLEPQGIHPFQFLKVALQLLSGLVGFSLVK